MENYKSFLFVLGIFLLGRAKAENKTEPRVNVNLGPIQGWRSAYYCMIYNESASCSDKDQLADKEVVDVSKDELAEYCKKGGCGEHIGYVLKCIHDVKRDFWFANNITVKLLKERISDGCAKNEAISTKNYTNLDQRCIRKYIWHLLRVLYVRLLLSHLQPVEQLQLYRKEVELWCRK